ncbi:MAG TPA: hypothetical protein VLQ45_35230 [Thermoanaerobaculia bacterium]|nr:hypothetical protein [Thermoanaerobaculia bacterium]
MFSQLPGFLDRSFFIGFLLPSVLFTTGVYLLLRSLGIEAQPDLLPPSDPILDVTAFGLAISIIAIVLLVINRPLTRILEGYGRFNPFRTLLFLERRRYHKLQNKIKQAKQERAKHSTQKELPAELANQLIANYQMMAERFPDQEAFLLPTAFGNTLRAFEVYPRVIYGLEAIGAWNRLLTVVPRELRESLDATKALMDFWVNLWFLSLSLSLSSAVFLLFQKRSEMIWLPPVLVLLSWLAAKGARSAAVEWGDLIKATFDMFLPDLWRKLGLNIPSTDEEYRQSTDRLNQAFLYRKPRLFKKKTREAQASWMKQD